MNKEVLSENPRSEIWQGDCIDYLKTIPDNSIDCIITSPPYYCLRDYGVEGQIGLEPTFDEYQNKLLMVFGEIKRVLKKSGSFWLNIGDIYCSGKYVSSKKTSLENRRFDKFKYSGKNGIHCGRARGLSVSNKCMMMMPERIALKMIDEQGWILRQKIIWAKQILLNKEKRTIGSAMPASVKDRFNMSWEYLYHFVKNKKYYFDLDTVKIPYQTFENRPDGIVREREFNYNTEYPEVRNPQKIKNYRGKFLNHPKAEKFGSPRARTKKHLVDSGKRANGNYYNVTHNPSLLGKNIPTVWQINPEPHNFKKELGAETDHFATFPQLLVEIPIISSCPKNGVVLDPFMGSGTTGVTCANLHRNFIGIEKNKSYCFIAKHRIKKACNNQPLL